MSQLKDPSAFAALTTVHKKAVLDCCFSPNTNQILTASEDNSLVLWNLPDPSLELHDETINDEHKLVCYKLSAHKMPVMSVAMSKNFFISASKDGQAKLWKLLDNEHSQDSGLFKCPNPQPSTYNCHTQIVRTISISTQSRDFATGSDDKSVKIWSIDCRNKLILSLLNGHTNWINCVRYSKLHDSLLASCGDDGKICIWDTRMRQPPLDIIASQRSTKFNSLDWHPIFDHHIVSGAQDSSCIVWDLRNKKQVQVYVEHTGSVNSVVFSNSGSLLLTGSQDKSCKIFDVCQGRNIFTLKSHNAPITSVCFDTSDDLFASASQDKATTIWKKNFDAVVIEAGESESLNDTNYGETVDTLNGMSEVS